MMNIQELEEFGFWKVDEIYEHIEISMKKAATEALRSEERQKTVN